MGYIQTVLGNIDQDEIGFTDSHEHIIRIGGGEVVYGGHNFLLDSYENGKKELLLYKAAGGRTIVEMTPCGSGRDIESLIRLSKETGINIVGNTGFQKSDYYENNTHIMYRYSKEELSGLFIADIEEGIDKNDYSGPIVKRSTAKAGVIKAGTSYQVITDAEVKVFEAAAIASKETGAPISFHCERGTVAAEAVDILLEAGVLQNNIIVCHIDRNPDTYYHTELLKRGVYLEYDGPARVKYYTDEVILNLIKNVIKAGYEDQILLGLDLGTRSYLKSYSGGPGMDYLQRVFIPRMKAEKITEQVINKFMILNPGNAFAIKK